MQAQSPIISSHRGRQVVLSRRSVSPHVLGIARVRATELLDSFPRAADTRDWIEAARKQLNGGFGMMGNDALGDCTAADGFGHLTEIWTANNGPVVVPSDAQVVSFYSKTTGYNPADPSTDQGGVETDVLATWQKGWDGLTTRLKLWVPVTPTNLEHVYTAIERYGAAYSGVALPLTAQDQAVWTLDEKNPARAVAGSWGGHCVSWSAYDRLQRLLRCVTWGMEQGAMIDWWAGYGDECYALLADTVWTPNGVSPLGDSIAVLAGNIQGLAS